VNVLVCDDDRSTRFIVKRILTQQFGLVVTECSDGLEAMQALARGRFHLMLLDIELPTMSGIEVLELMRESSTTKDLPVIVLSNVRDGDAVKYLLKLGVSDYLLKPPRTDRLVEKVQRLLKVLPRTQAAEEDGTGVRMSQASPSMVVDGDPEFRRMLTGELRRYGTVVEADSGAAAMTLFREKPVALVFVGGDLGVVGPQLLVRKLRQSHSGGPLRVVGVVDDVGLVPRDRFDAVIQRSRLPRMLRASLRPFVRAEGAMSALAVTVPDLPEIVSMATSQILGMMIDVDVSTTDADVEVVGSASAEANVEVAERFIVSIGFHVNAEIAGTVATKMFGADYSAEGADDRAAVATELVHLVTGRLHAILSERAVHSVNSAEAGPSSTPLLSDTDQVVISVAIPEVGDLLLDITVRDRLAIHPDDDGPALAACEAAGAKATA
jgi:DNA-binding response OmpR family regulator